jgi:putative oxygen-independent coproporphyrinogen III oxidase
MTEFRFAATPPLALYVHFPWCVRKCPYCDFNSHALRGDQDPPEDRYVDALLVDLERDLPAVWGRTVGSVFLGGGTPSLFSAAAIDRLLCGIRARVSLSPDAEITLEANPGAAEQNRFSGYRAAGVNRISIGAQSFHDPSLEAIGRIHNAQQVTRAFQAASDAGFSAINLDLMFGLPGQNCRQAQADLEAALALQPGHLSWYQLTLEANTLFHVQPPQLPDEQQQWQIQTTGQTLLAAHGYTQYEVSAFALQGQRCRHNLNYWRFGDYLGIGAGAHAKVTDAANGRIVRMWKKRHPRQYLDAMQSGHFVAGERALSTAEAVFEFALNRLRLREPLSYAEFEAASGLSRKFIEPQIERARVEGLLNVGANRIEHTETGWLFLDDLLQRFLPEERRDVV